MSLKVFVCNVLSLVHDTVKFGLSPLTTCVGPFLAIDPGLKDEEGAEVYSSDLFGCWKPPFVVRLCSKRVYKYFMLS